jgi:hypothetical protein
MIRHNGQSIREFVVKPPSGGARSARAKGPVKVTAYVKMLRMEVESGNHIFTDIHNHLKLCSFVTRAKAKRMFGPKADEVIDRLIELDILVPCMTGRLEPGVRLR